MLCILGVIMLFVGLLAMLGAQVAGAAFFTVGALCLAIDSVLDDLRGLRKDLARYEAARAADRAAEAKAAQAAATASAIVGRGGGARRRPPAADHSATSRA